MIDKIPLTRTITSIIIFLNQLGSFWSGTEIPDDLVVHHEQTCDYDMFPLHVTGQRTQDDETDSDLSDDWIMWRAVLITRLSRNSSDSCRIGYSYFFFGNRYILGNVCHLNAANGFKVYPMWDITFSWKEKKQLLFLFSLFNCGGNYRKFLSKHFTLALLRNKSRELFWTSVLWFVIVYAIVVGNVSELSVENIFHFEHFSVQVCSPLALS